MDLSMRLTAIASLVTEGNRVADIGTDHGYIPIYLIKNHKIQSALAMDIGKGPLKRAEDHVKAHCLEEVIQCRLSDGFSAYNAGEADTAVIAGMGGDLMVRILTAGLSKLPDELILQPQSEWFKVRQFLGEHGYKIVCEDMVKEDGKYYEIIKAQKGEPVEESTVQQYYGPLLLGQKHPVLKDYLEYSMDSCNKIGQRLEQAGTEAAKSRMQELQIEIQRLKEAFAYYEG